MEKDLTIRFEIEIPYHNVIGALGLIFHRWLPDKKDSIIINKDAYKVKLYFDKDCRLLYKFNFITPLLEEAFEDNR